MVFNALALGARSLRTRPYPRLVRHFAASANQAKENQSFKSQLYESTQQRLKRERAEQEKFAQYQTQSPAGRSAALVFGMRYRDNLAFSSG
jgi:D-lactate dehydrogenase (cytochrome)